MSRCVLCNQSMRHLCTSMPLFILLFWKSVFAGERSVCICSKIALRSLGLLSFQIQFTYVFISPYASFDLFLMPCWCVWVVLSKDNFTLSVSSWKQSSDMSPKQPVPWSIWCDASVCGLMEEKFDPVWPPPSILNTLHLPSLPHPTDVSLSFTCLPLSASLSTSVFLVMSNQINWTERCDKEGAPWGAMSLPPSLLPPTSPATLR